MTETANVGLLDRILARTDLMAAVAVVTVVTMLIIPLPPTLLDFFITMNISGGLMIVVTSMYLNSALEFSAFPSLLLLTTMFRLAINISVTRQILSTGNAGSVVKAFGQFVVNGNVVIGLVIFLILVVIQFVVVTNGAGRVAEVAARFTLDAMPGKQMAIDADLNAGMITDKEARQRRSDIAREADFYGAMDGASKFVRGDATAAVLITGINLVGGIVIGLLHRHLSFSQTINTYSILTVGDGLAAQIPALLISVATGIIVTRTASERDLGSEIAKQILSQQKATIVAGCVITAFALVPGLPKIPFLLIGGGLTPDRAPREQAWPTGRRCSTLEPEPPKQPELPAGDKVARDTVLKELPIDALELGVGFGLVPLVDRRAGGTLAQRVSMIRRQIAGDLGMVIPRVRIHDEVDLDSHEYVFKVRGSEVARGKVMAGHLLAMDPGDAVGKLQGIATTEPAFGLPAVWIHQSMHAEAEALGYTVVDGESVIVTHLTETIRGNAAQLLDPPGRAAAARSAQGHQRGGRQRGGPRRAHARRDPARAAGPARRGRLDPRPRRDRRGDRRQGQAHPRPEPARRIRPSGARSRDHRPLPRRSTAHCMRSPSIPRSSTRSSPRSRRQPRASTSRWSRPVLRPCSRHCAHSRTKRYRRAACARCCCAPRGSDGISGVWSSRRCRTWPYAPTTRSPPESASRPSEL